MSAAQQLFDNKSCILDPLNTSGELDGYVVEDVDTENSTVHFTHRSSIKERYDNLKSQDKSLKQKVSTLEEKVSILEQKVSTLEQDVSTLKQAAAGHVTEVDKDILFRWELISRAIEGMNLFLWRTVLLQPQRDQMEEIGIFTMEDLRKRQRDSRVRPIYRSIPNKYHDILQTMASERHSIYLSHCCIARPSVTRQEFLDYIHSVFPSFEADLRPISDFQHEEFETGFVRQLFVD